MKRKKRIFGEFKLEPITEIERIPIGEIVRVQPTVIYGPSGKIVAGKPKKKTGQENANSAGSDPAKPPLFLSCAYRNYMLHFD